MSRNRPSQRKGRSSESRETRAGPARGRRPVPKRVRAERGAVRRAAQRRRRLRNMAAGAVGALVLGAVISLAVLGHGAAAGYTTSSTGWVLPRLGSPGKVSLANFRGRPVVVNFFASWCTVCASELPVFAQDARLLRGQVDVVEVDALETGNGLAFAQRFGLRSSVAAVARDVGASQNDGLYQTLGGTGSMPMTGFYSAQGTLLTTHVGGFDAATLGSEFRHLYGLTA